MVPAIALATSLGDGSSLRAAHAAAGELIEPTDVRAALGHYRTAGHEANQARCHEQLGEYFEALELCEDADTGALARLADHGEPAIAQLIRTRQRAEAVRRAHQVVARFRRAVATNAAVRARLDRAERIAASVVDTARAELADEVQRAGDNARGVLLEWSELEVSILAGFVRDALLLDVVPFSLGIEVLGGGFSTHIPRHTTIPTRKTSCYTTTEDNQPIVRIGVYQGERPKAGDNVKIFELGIRAQPGMSGGPVFNDLGEVIGVVSFARIYAAPADKNAAVVATYNTSHAVNVTALRRMLARAGT